MYILSYTANTFRIDSDEYQKGSIDRIFWDGDTVYIYINAAGRSFRGRYSDFKNESGVVFASKAALRTYLSDNFFFKMTGGAGDALLFKLQSGTVATYANLPTGLNNLPVEDPASDLYKAWRVATDERVYVWDGSAFQADGAGIKTVGEELPNVSTLPYAGFINSYSFVYPAPTEINSIYYDPLDVVEIGNKLSSIDIYIPTNYSNGGIITIVALSANEVVLETHQATGLVEGLNSITWNKQFTEKVFIGVLANDARLAQDVSRYPQFSYPVRRKLLDEEWEDFVYPLGIEIMVEDYSETTKAIANKAIYIINTATSQINAKLAAGGVINLDSGKEYIIDDTKVLKSGTIINGNKAILKFAPGLNKMFELNDREDVASHYCEFQGNYPTLPNTGANYSVAGSINTIQNLKDKLDIGTEIVFNMEKVGSIDIIGNKFKNISAYGIIGKEFNADYLAGVAIERNIFQYGYLGLELSEKAEYCRIANNVFAFNQINIWNAAGNNSFLNNKINGARVNFYAGPGYNAGHGEVTGGSLNHAALAGIVTEGLEHGFEFGNISNWGAHIYIIDCQGVHIKGSRVNSNIYVEGAYGPEPLSGQGAVVRRNKVSGCFIAGEIFENWNGKESYLCAENNTSPRGPIPLNLNNIRV